MITSAVPVVRLTGQSLAEDVPIQHSAEPLTLFLDGLTESFSIECDEVRLGTSPKCELRLPDGPSLHSIIRQQDGVSWIEAVDGASLVVNGRSRRRMALREGDVLEVSGHTFNVRFDHLDAGCDSASLVEDLTLLTAEELCDRIAAEQNMVNEFSQDQFSGWEKLLAAVHATHEEEHPTDVLPMALPQSLSAVATTADCERLFVQIRELSDLMDGHTDELDHCENELIAATSLLEEAQERVSHQIEELLDQLQAPVVEHELRVSA
jgi:hypothetical protein